MEPLRATTMGNMVGPLEEAKSVERHCEECGKKMSRYNENERCYSCIEVESAVRSARLIQKQEIERLFNG